MVASPNGNPVVVVVEDDIEINELERELLSIHGFDSVPAYDGIEALEVCRQVKPDAVLLDVMLPEMDGYQTCCHLRSQPNDGVPIIMISALAEADSRNKGLASGANAYFAKPFDADQIVGALRKLIP